MAISHDGEVRYAEVTAGGPPAPVVRLFLDSPSTGKNTQEIRGIIDSGAAMTCVPTECVKHLEEELDYRFLRVTSAIEDGKRKAVRLNLRFNEVVLRDVEVLLLERPYALLGRDIINRYRLLLDGTEEWWEFDHEDI